ncbi:hypothetical protein M6B38_294430 [Iris pallida]|uniref:Uncharacterized protein n=1 Tax=Iris pallida TaxID=29817 RepID=A0AAX6HU25_IRIPA|nr:hypothetical protein M6B38_294430 [Iris pallida]
MGRMAVPVSFLLGTVSPHHFFGESGGKRRKSVEREKWFSFNISPTNIHFQQPSKQRNSFFFTFNNHPNNETPYSSTFIFFNHQPNIFWKLKIYAYASRAQVSFFHFRTFIHFRATKQAPRLGGFVNSSRG